MSGSARGFAGMTVEFDPASGPGVVAMVRLRLEQWLLRTGLSQLSTHELLIAVGEAVANAYEHSGASSSPDAPACTVPACVQDGQILVSVADRGRWLERPASAQARNRGRGRLIMAELVDRVHTDTGAHGTTVTLVRAAR